MSPETQDGLPPGIAEQMRGEESELESGLDSRLSYPFAVEFQRAILKEIAPGGEFNTSVPLIVAMMKDANPSTLERRERPNPAYTTQPIATVCDTVQRNLDQLYSEVKRAEIGQGPESARRLETEEVEIKALSVEAEILRTRLKARGKDSLQASEAKRVIEQLSVVDTELRRKKQGYARSKEKLSLAAENLESLTPKTDEEKTQILERLDRKAEQMAEFGRAAIGLGRLGEFFHNYMKMSGDIDALMKMFTEFWIEKLSSDDLAPLTSLPGLGRGIDVAFKTMLRLDAGQGMQNPDVLPGFPRNLCATADVTRKTRIAFKRALLRKVETDLATDPELASSARPLARASVDIAMALHEILYMSAYYHQPRNPTTGEIIQETDNRGEPIKVESTGSLYLGGNDTVGKVYGIRGKLLKDLESGYSVPMTIAFRDLPDNMFFDLLNAISFTDPSTGQEINATEALLSDTHTIGQVFEHMSLTAHSSSLYEMFNAQRIFKLLSEIPREQFVLLPGKIDAPFKACREFALWLPGLRKALEKGYAKTLSEEDRAVEVNRILANVTIAFLRKAIDNSVLGGGDRANTESGITDEASNDVVRYLRERLSHELPSMSYKLITFIGAVVVDAPEVYGITKEDIENIKGLKETLGLPTSDKDTAARKIADKKDLENRIRQKRIKNALKRSI